MSVFVATLAAACGSGSSSGPPATGPSTAASTGASTAAEPNGTANPTLAKEDVAALYTKFFTVSQPEAVTLLQNGTKLSKAVAAAAKLKGTASESAKVYSVTFPSATTATVTYSLSTNGTVVLGAGGTATGMAVYVDGKWVFSEATFCGLVQLTDPKVAGCPR